VIDGAKPEGSDDGHGLPKGFRIMPDGIHREIESDGETEWVWLCSLIRVLALPRAADGTNWGRLVKVTDPDGRNHRWAVPASMFAGDGTELRANLMSLGLDLASGPKARAAFSDLMMRWQPKERATTTVRLGWADESCRAFALGDGRVLGDGSVVFQSESVATAAAEIRPAGTLEGWREGVGRLCSGNPLLMVAVSAAFAGALLEPLDAEGGGLHYRASSRGKSTAQRGAVSVWGAPGFKQTWRATSNGLEGIATVCNSTILALDELAEVNGRDAGAAAYMLANGTGKARVDRSGHARTPAHWRVLVLSSGEISLSDKLAEEGQRGKAGQGVRLLDIRADTRPYGLFDELHGHQSGAAMADAVKAAAAAHHGTAGPAFVEAWLGDPAEYAARARRSVADFKEAALKGCEPDGQVERVAARLGLIAAAGELATTFGLTGWVPGEARDSALEVFRLWLDGRGGGGAAEARAAVDRLRAFLVAHGSSRFETIPPDGRIVSNRAGWIDGETFLIAQDAWQEIHADSDPIAAARHLAAAGHLIRSEPGRFTTRMAASVPGRPRAYAVRADIMGAGDAH
jgi:putative DNA primase/helicase